MKNTKIQWCHSTINPRMGCDGCELWKPAAAIVAILLTTLMLLIRKPKTAVKQALALRLPRKKERDKAPLML